MTEELESRLNWLYAVDGTEKERATPTLQGRHP